MSVPDFTNEFRFRIFLTKLRTTNFGRFAFFSIFMTFSVNIMLPIIPVYVLRNLEFNYVQFTAVMMLAIIFSFISMTYWGPLSDLYGNYRILFTTAVVLPLLPVGWIVLKNFYLLLILQMFSGFVQAGFNISTTNFIFDAVRRENISKIMAYFNTLNTTCAFLGAAIGGLLVNTLQDTHFPGSIFNAFTTVFAVSLVLRILVVLAYLKGFKEVRNVAPSPGVSHFYVYRPAFNMINRFHLANGRIFRQRKDE
jgi:MFS family permease